MRQRLRRAVWVAVGSLGCVAVSSPAPGAIVSPTDLTGVALWLDANDVDGNGTAGGTLVNSGAATWVDKSGNGYDAVQSVSASIPTPTANALNGKTVLRFDGGDYFDLASSANSLNSGFLDVTGGNATVFVVSKTTDDSSTRRLLNVQAGDGTRFGVLYEAGKFSYLHSSGYNTVSVTRGEVSSYRILAGTRNGTSQVLSIDGEAVGSNTLGGDVTTDRAYVGVYINSGRTTINGHLVGDIAEVLVYNRALSTTERHDVESYLGDKWGIALVPEPASMGLLLTGMVGLLGRRRRHAQGARGY